MIGGDAAPQTQLTVYDIATNSWSTGNPAPAGVFLSGYQTVGNYLYIVGGFGASSAANSTATMRLDMSTGIWSSGPAFTPQRADFALASSGTKLYAIGGDLTGGSYFELDRPRQRAGHGELAGRKLGGLTAEPAGACAAGELGRLQLDRPCRRRDLVDGRDQREYVPVPVRSSLSIRGSAATTTTATATTTSATATTATATSATATSTSTSTTATATTATTATAAAPATTVRCRVPRVIGLRLGAAKTRIRRARCSVGRIRRARSRRVGRVIGQSPRPGEVKPRGFPVKLVVGRR